MTPAPHAQPRTFEQDAVQALLTVRRLFAKLMEHKCQADRSVSRIAEAFDIHRKLAWQVGKVAYDADPFVAARHMPTAKGLEVWLAAARRAGCRVADIKAAVAAGETFHALGATHTRSEEEFEMLLGSRAGDAAAHAKWRQQSFHGNSFIWGAHCKVLFTMQILQPSDEKKNYFHMAQVRGLLGFRQTRENVRWLINQAVVADDHAHTSAPKRIPLDPASAKKHSGVPVLPRYCSTPMPLFSRRTTPGGVVHDEFVTGPVGQAGERTLVTGEVVRNLGLAHATETDRTAHFGAGVRIPTELLHLDTFVHHSLFGPVERDACMFSDLTADVSFEEADALPLPERLQSLGRGVGLAQTPDVPGYAELAADVFDRLDADPSEYELYRVRVPYPPMPVTVMVRHPLPPEKH